MHHEDAWGTGEGTGRGPLRRIVGFRRDEEDHWVAELSCGHGHHVRDDPPWVERPWVRTEEGRSSRLGAPLRCARCEDGEPVPAADAGASAD